ncbi:MAG: Dolichyl-phosphate-mannose-protein mannosyltransferase [Microgenomates group bacterium GW2011_GWA1_48_10]|nr:MAG: Dolichyl-phosphate-mannose-protein mannosyltransferase [Microgenomates group bacterium GW2011_GWA1_48_10]
MTRFLNWLDNNILTLLAGFLLLFIPLYPKIPLFDVLYGYNVRVRAEDLAIALTMAVFCLQLLRWRVRINLDPVTIGIFTYLFFGLASVVVSVFILQTIPLQYLHVAKTVLHWLRRIEYFSLFFILFGAIKSIRTTKAMLILFFVTMVGVILYGYGQKYFYFPAFSTMNREFSKGWVLYLTEHARVLSTFGGHYDLAGYLVIGLSLAWSFFFGLKNKLPKLVVGLILAGGFWLLILTASRISFIAYLIGLSVVIFLWMFRRGLEWGLSRWVVATFLSILVMLSFGDLSDRFLRIIRLDERVGGLRNVLMRPAGTPPQNRALFLDNTNSTGTSDVGAVTSRSDKPPTPARPGDVTGNEEPLLVPQAQPDGSIKYVEKTRSYSSCAVKYDLSTCIRLEVTWPRAIEAWKTDPFLGTGYATLSKSRVQDFTEAESTDGDYFRALGETGTLGFIAFYGTIIVMATLAFRALSGIKDPFLYSLTAGFIALSVGLLANAALIDIFESSKVAYIFWAMSGITLGSLYLSRDQIARNREPLRVSFDYRKRFADLKAFFLSDKPWLAAILIASLWLHTYKLNSPIADWHSWRQADTSAVTRNFVKEQNINWLYPTFDDLSAVASGEENPMGYRFVEFPLYNAVSAYPKLILPELSVEVVERLVTAFASALTALFLFLICRKLFNRRIGYFAALTYTLLPYNIFYGRAILPDPMMVMLSLGAIYFAVKYIFAERLTSLALAGLMAALALLVKPFAIFLLAPIAYLWFAGFKFSWRKWLFLAIVMGLSLLPFLLWRLWVSRPPEGIPASDWLFNGDGIRFKGAFWYWLFADRIGRLILGCWGLILLGFGVIRKVEGKFKLFPILFFISSLLYLFVFATGNVRHDYYQILLIPSLAILVGLGLDFLLSTSNSLTNNLITKPLAIASFVFMLGFGWYFVRDYFNINHPEIVEAGKAVEKLTNDKALILAPYGGDTAFLYQTNRKGWPIVEGTIDDMIKKGAQYYVSVQEDDLTKHLINDSWPVWIPRPEKIVKKYKLLDRTPTYTIIQLVPDHKLP